MPPEAPSSSSDSPSSSSGLLTGTLENARQRIFLQQPTSTLLLQASGVLTAVWVYRSMKTMNRFLEGRYADIFFQIRRPSSIANRLKGFKFLVLGGLIIPVSALGVWCLSGQLLDASERSASSMGSRHSEAALGRAADGKETEEGKGKEPLPDFSVPRFLETSLHQKFSLARYRLREWIRLLGVGTEEQVSAFRNWASFNKDYHGQIGDEIAKRRNIADLPKLQPTLRSEQGS
uniref:Transmembrane protein n=1 Tax=Chromera velia CCMP2878 TaxID=1169474 RepID=A0A0G4FPD9_9ALVE|eukprot:Cvel_3597.t1-p1 / transcript=Cvel_3597.t1 / gene=Cvel_3597 / organism=Chromera_velia_CCMP2878 / gene_product=hypothetical protein / transcript_product=hypothetical protein / location=Cvel_scaffold147:79035-81323(-) / protein_length=232 / sequence_SO=supercontig / SO=protein_coding / is_pseudo=false